jgi:sirohydrochlorin ferrochelatase
MRCRNSLNHRRYQEYPAATLFLTVVAFAVSFSKAAFIITTTTIPCGVECAFCTHQRPTWQQRQAQHSDDEEAASTKDDLFDYFDPLLSPHAYPDGISPDKPPVDIKQQQQQQQQQQHHKQEVKKKNSSFGFMLEQQKQQQQEQQEQQEQQQEQQDVVQRNEAPDLFEYFDPLLSPHAYPHGISPDKPPVDMTQQKQKQNQQQSRLQSEKGTARLSTAAVSASATRFGFNLGGGNSNGGDAWPQSAPKEKTSTKAKQSSSSSSSPPPFFDPTLSPHVYTNGTPDKLIGDIMDVDDTNVHHHNPPAQQTGRVIGILLMDHGSRNQASNQRLHDLAALYQESSFFANTDSDDVTVVVQAAHMEIASPSVPQGIEMLLQRGVETIICHPFFLAPAGRHVSEDIPRIIQQAVQDLKINVDKIPVVTTDALGAQTHVMLRAIHSSIQKSTSVFNQKT